MANLFITNATGYIGSAVAELFKAKGYNVTALTRSDKAVEEVEKRGYKAYRGDLRKPQEFAAAITDADIVIHTAFARDQDYGAVDQHATETILELLKGTNKTFLYTSGTWVLGNTGNILADETTPTNPIKAAQWRVELEKKVVAAKDNGIRSVVVRPTVVYGREGGLIASFYATAQKDGYARYVGTGENYVSLVHVEDLANLYYIAAEKAAAGALLHATNEQPLTLKQIAELVAIASGFPGETKSWNVEDARKIYGDAVEGFVLDQRIDSKKTRETLNWAPKAPTLVDELPIYAGNKTAVQAANKQ
ncbi:MAG: NAD-dependent epimerase/dehydratase family protein [Leptolyngbya sp.]|nr:NAD-dependent epimerase/dehydratase family protein [Candidatus Melainabacteria bacterium]